MACNNGFSRRAGEKVVLTVRGFGGVDVFPSLRVLDCQGNLLDEIQIPEVYRWTLEDDRIYELLVHRLPAGGAIEVAHQFEGEPPIVDHCTGGPDPSGPWSTFACSVQQVDTSPRALRVRAARRRALAIALLVFGLPLTLKGAGTSVSPVNEIPPHNGEAIKDYENRLVGAISGKPIGQAIDQKTTSTAAPEGFGDRVHDTISDFLPLFQGSVDAVSTSQDKKSVTVKFSPFKLRFAEIAASGTATQPDVFETLSEAIAASARDTQKKALLNRTNDFSDLTWNLEINGLAGEALWTRSFFLGRSVKTYHRWIGTRVGDFASGTQSQQQTKLDHLQAELGSLLKPGQSKDMTFEAVRAGGVDETKLLEVIREIAQARVERAQGPDTAELARYPALIDNQPQLVFKVSRRESDEVVGPRSTAYTLSYELGSRNVNAVLREYSRLKDGHPENPDPGDPERRRQAIENVTSNARFGAEDRLVANITYKDVDDYHFLHPYTFTIVDSAGADIQVTRTAKVDLARSRELRGKLVWTRFIRASNAARAAAQSTGSGGGATGGSSKDQKPRLTASLEAVSVRDDPTRHNQVIGKLSYVLPLGSNGLTLPLTITWANRPEFVGQSGSRLSAHVSVSFKSNAIDSGS